MANEPSTKGTCSSQVTSESSESTIEINIKTLDSQIYTFRVNKDMPVPMLKEKLVNATGVPVEQQRLIFRGKVLKDDHLLSEYHLEDGHTLHLVARQPVQGQPSPGTGSEGTHDNNNQGNDSTASAPRNRVGQVAHSVVLGTVNIADQGESMVADIGRLVGAALSSLGVGNLISTGTVSNTSSATVSNPVPSSVEAEGTQNASGRTLSGNPAPPGFTVLNHPFQSLHQIPQFPSTRTQPQHMVIPDSLTTLSEFISRMELALQNSASQSSPSTIVRNPPQSEIPSVNVRGLPTPEMLGSVMEQVQQLLRGDAAGALSRVSTRLEREGTSTDPVVRGQIQAEAMHVGLAMQHLGSMLLELGRTIMMLRMRQSPAESSVNAGPAVYISPAGPNPIMVQPFPLQTNSLFGVSSPPFVGGVSGPFTTGDPSRNINIHIHAGSSVTPGASFTATRASSGEAVRGERPNAEQASRNDNGSGDSAPTRGLPSRTVFAAIPARPTAETASHGRNVIYPVHMRSQLAVPIHSASAQSSHPTVSSGMQTNAPILVPQPSSESGTFPTLVAQVASALGGNAQGLSLSSHSMQSIDTQGPRPTTGCEAQPDMVSSSAQIPSVADTSSMLETQINAINAQLPSALSSNAQGQSLSPSVQCTDTSCTKGPELVPPGLMSSGLGENDVNGHAGNVADAEDSGSSASVKPHVPHISMPESGQQLQPEGLHNPNDGDSRGSSVMEEDLSTTTSTGGSTVCQPSHTLPDQTEAKSSEKNPDSVATVHASQSSQGSGSDRITPLGLGLGSLQPKRRGKLAKPVGKDKVSCDTPSSNQNQQSVAKGQQFLHSLASHSSDMNRVNANGSSNPPSSIIGQIMDGMPLGGQGGSGQVGAADMMSQILQSPAFNSLLTGVAAHTGIGSSADLRGMLEQCTRSPAVRNTLNEIAQQVEGQPQDIGAMLSGFGRGFGRGQGGIDFSRLFQQMMPAMSQTLGRGSTRSAPHPGLEPDDQPQCSGGKTGGDDMLHIRNSQIDLQQAVERIEQHDAPGDVFRAVLESAGHLYGEGNSFEDLVDELADNADLRDEFVGMFCRDLRRRMQTDSIAED